MKRFFFFGQAAPDCVQTRLCAVEQREGNDKSLWAENLSSNNNVVSSDLDRNAISIDDVVRNYEMPLVRAEETKLRSKHETPEN